MRQVSGTLRIDLAQFREKEAFSMFSSDLDAETIAQLKKGKLMVELLKQNKGGPMATVDQVISLYAGTRNLISDVPSESVDEFEKGLLASFQEKHGDVRRSLAEKGSIDKDLEETLRTIILEYKKEFLDGSASRN